MEFTSQNRVEGALRSDLRSVRGLFALTLSTVLTGGGVLLNRAGRAFYWLRNCSKKLLKAHEHCSPTRKNLGFDSPQALFLGVALMGFFAWHW